MQQHPIKKPMEAKIELDSLEEEGQMTIPAKILLDMLKEFPEQP